MGERRVAVDISGIYIRPIGRRPSDRLEIKYSQIDLPLSWAWGARTDDTGRLEQTNWTSLNGLAAYPSSAAGKGL